MNKPIKAIIGLGNPGTRFDTTRHNIGFEIVDKLVDTYHGTWQKKDRMEVADIRIGDHNLLVIKPQTYMNDSGQIMPVLAKKGIKAENMLVVHDELELPFAKVVLKQGGSHRGHNGLRSLIEFCGKEFARIRFGIGRPERKEDVAEYVLARFTEPQDQIAQAIDEAVAQIERVIKNE